ncbi:hypothetical protein KPH14_009779 [Odynerus spinipes]|uniref:BTB domain-containing protein n=1 Tax=Odynerus spinipes TaxID=1348599 RepID=A0AAD9RVW7_9HYME|nr:hypothetical protein KPH14_009779 [Odynerus spinipes]
MGRRGGRGAKKRPLAMVAVVGCIVDVRTTVNLESTCQKRRKCEADGKEAKAELTAQRTMFPSAQIKMRLLSPSSSPATSPTMSNSSSPTPPTPVTPVYNQKMTGIPCVAAASRYTAPVHIDVGGTIYTSSLETLTKYPESRLAKLFNGSIPIVLDSLKQHYFIDRDGGMFRHILNFMRNSRLLIPENFADLDLLLEEARYFDIAPMCKQLEQIKKERIKNGATSLTSSTIGTICSTATSTASAASTMTTTTSSSSPKQVSGRQIGMRGKGASGCSLDCTGCPSCSACDHEAEKFRGTEGNRSYECVALHVNPDLGERIMLSGGHALLDEVFPEAMQAVINARSGIAWHQQDTRHVIRFPLNGFCKLNSVQAITRLLNAGFRIVASSGGGGEGQQFSEYLFVRQAVNT